MRNTFKLLLCKVQTPDKILLIPEIIELNLPKQTFRGSNAMRHFLCQLLGCSWHTDFDYRLLHLPGQDKVLKGVTGQDKVLKGVTGQRCDWSTRDIYYSYRPV
jgi:hypothetical protein